MENKILLGVGLGFFLLISGLSLFLSSKQKPLPFGIVDTRVIIAEQAKRIAKEDQKAHLSPLKMRALADQIEGQIDQWGTDKQVILLAKAAVLSGKLPDYTQEILGALASSHTSMGKDKL